MVRPALLRSTLLLAFSLAACQDQPPATPTPTPQEIAAGLRPAIQLEGEAPATYTLQERMAEYGVPGVSVALLDGGEVVWAQGWGVADTETGRPVGPTTLFQAASISKPVAALTAMTLVEEGAVELDGPVNEFMISWRVPDNEFTADSVVTLRGLLSHTAGLTVWGFPGYRKDQPFGPDQPLASNAQVLDGLGNTDMVRVYKVPGISWQYSGGGYTVMEQMVEDVTGLPFHEAARERVLDPAGMTLSTYAQPLPEDRWDEASRAHRGDGSEIPGEWHNYPEQAAAGLWTTPGELLTLSAHLLDILDGEVSDGVVTRETLEEMLTPHRGGEEGFNPYGLGFGIGEEADDTTFGHGGSNAGFRSQWVVYRGRQEGAVVMTNGDRGGALSAEILRSISSAFGWPGYQPEVRAARRPGAEELAAYEGSFQAPGGGLTVTITAGDGVLRVEVPGQGAFDLHADATQDDVFFDLDDGQEIHFERDESGAVVAALPGGQTRFTRVEGEG